MEWANEDFSITTDKSKIDISYVHRILSNSYWSENIPFAIVQRSITGSLCFALFFQQKQIGFARVISDEATFAYLADVFIDPDFQGKGLSKWLIKTIMDYPSLQGLRRILLATRDAHGLYRQFGFTPLSSPERWMQVHNPDVYKRDDS